jgi:GWxTD domain-containing protein
MSHPGSPRFHPDCASPERILRPRGLRPAAALLLPLLAAVLAASACASARLIRSLDPDSRDFFSKVRYLITIEEKREFLNLPPAERPAFIVEFWKKRDPTPDTEENEFRDDYFQRLEEANRLFGAGGGGEPGWLQDRGRIYILLGPPDHRETYPRGETFYGKPCEYWYYGYFPIYFIDDGWNGSYRLDPDSAVQLAEIMKTQLLWKPQLADGLAKTVLDGRVDVVPQGPGRARVRIRLPYREIWFKSEGPILTAVLTTHLDVKDSSDKSFWEFRESYPLKMTPAELEKKGAAEYIIEIPVELAAGHYWMVLTLTSSSDTAKVTRRIPLDL